MGQQDITEKLLEDYPDVFADIMNVFLFHGEQVVREEELQETDVLSQYKADTTQLHQQERDILKLWVRKGKPVYLGVENQTTSDADMPLRIINYDGASYRKQLLKDSGKQENEADGGGAEGVKPKSVRYPVVTIVLYFGDRPWKKNKTLRERVGEVEGICGEDYKIHVFEIAHLTDEQIAMFRSDFRIIAEYFVKRRRGEAYEGNRQPIRHVDAVLKFMSVFAEDQRFLNLHLDQEKEEINMCVILDRIENRGREEGIQIGREMERAEAASLLNQAEKRGKRAGVEEGMELGMQLLERLWKEGRTEEISRIREDQDYRRKLLQEYGLI